jgi:hypothetical protein
VVLRILEDLYTQANLKERIIRQFKGSATTIYPSIKLYFIGATPHVSDH